jgi:hypothetical protein
MNKQEIENKLKEIIKYSRNRNVISKQHISDETFMAKEVFNFALELVAENAQCEEGAIVDLGFEIMSATVDKQSILDLKL